MIVACVLAILVNGEFEDHIVTGDVLKDEGIYYVVDFQNAVSGLNGQGNYAKVVIPSNRCAIRRLK